MAEPGLLPAAMEELLRVYAPFGLGIHRCAGSQLARMELRVALEVWLERIPAFALADPAAVTWSAGQVRGPRTLPVRILRQPRPSWCRAPSEVPQPGDDIDLIE